MGRSYVILSDAERAVLNSLLNPPYREIPAQQAGTVTLEDRNGTIKFPDTCSAGTNSLHVPTSIAAINGFRFSVIVPVAYSAGIEVHYSPIGTMYWVLARDTDGLTDMSYDILCAAGEITVVGAGSVYIFPE